VSPPQSRAQNRRQRGLYISLGIVVVTIVAWLGGTLASGWSPRLGLDLAGGLSVVYKPATHASASDLSQTVTVLTNRVNGLGVSGASVQTQGNDIVVSVPGVNNARSVLKTIGETAQLLFRPALCYAPPFVGAKTTGALKASATLPSACPAANQLTAANLDVNVSAGQAENNPAPYAALADYPSTTPFNDKASATVLLPQLPGQGTTRYLLGPARLTGHAVKSAVAQEETDGSWVVNCTLTGTGSPEWDTFAEQYFHQIIAIELDGVIYSAPITQPAQSTFSSFAGTVQISGGTSFTEAYAKQLALALQFGSLPIRLDQLTAQTVSPSLGRSSLKAGLAAGLVGLLLVLIYTIVYYRLLGLVIFVGLALTAGLLWSIISALGHTSVAPSFDLAGVTGVIVSIGITVDSYIVYFERLKDETRAGRSVRTSVDRGFKSAWRTVVAADLVSLAAALVLFYVAVGDVKGFAFFLGLSTLLDLGMTYFFTRPLVILLGRNDQLTHAKRMGITRGLALGTES
jgi:preprotein translocase subunit SecD